MKIAFFADLHIGNYNEFNHHNSRLNRCLTALDLIYQKAKIRGCEIVVDTGDLIDKKNLLDFKVYNEIYHAFSEISKNYNLPTFSLVGNHNISIQGRPDVNNLVPLMEFLTPVDTTAWIPWPGKEPQVYLGFIPYQHDLDQWYNEQEWLLQHFPTDTTKPCLLVGHQEIKGAVTGTHRYVAGSGIDHRRISEKFSWGIFGHYHAHQNISPNVFYSGAALQQDFGEEGNPQGFWVFDTISGAWEYESLSLPAFFTVSDPQIAVNDTTNYYRISTPDLTDTDIEILSCEPHVRIESTTSTEVETRLSVTKWHKSDLIFAYIKEKVPESLQAAVRDAVLKLLNEME